MLVRGAGEPRWTAVVDAALAVAALGWVLLISFFEPGGTLQVAVPLTIVVVVVARVVVLVEYSQRWRDSGLADMPAPKVESTSEARAA